MIDNGKDFFLLVVINEKNFDNIKAIIEILRKRNLCINYFKVDEQKGNINVLLYNKYGYATSNYRLVSEEVQNLFGSCSIVPLASDFINFNKDEFYNILCQFKENYDLEKYIGSCPGIKYIEENKLNYIEKIYNKNK